MDETSTEYEDFGPFKVNKECARLTFSVITGVAIVGVVVFGLLLYPWRRVHKGGELIKLFGDLPKNSLIHCNLAVEGKYEECTVFGSQSVNLKGAKAALQLEKTINPILTEKGHFTAQCCVHKGNNTVMFTTMAKTSANEVGVSMQDCLGALCDDHVLGTKAARNRLYEMVADPDFEGCSEKGSDKTKPVTIRYENSPDLTLHCPAGFDLKSRNDKFVAMLYKYSLTRAPHKLTDVFWDSKEKILYFARFLGHNNVREEFVKTFLDGILESLQSTHTHK